MTIRGIYNRSRNFVRWIFNLPVGFHEEEFRLLKTYYRSDNIITHCDKKKIIVMIDGRTIHNGLSDRFKGICSAFRYAQNYGYDFRLFYHYPFDIETFLVPNEYDWTISEADIVYNTEFSKPILLNDYQIQKYEARERYLTESIKDFKQIHLYTNALFGEQRFSDDFNCLFKPTPLLQNELDKHLNLIGNNYITISLRFQCLLGDDFNEIGAKVLDKENAELLKDDVLQQIQLIRNDNLDKNVVVFSDSKIFLSYVSSRLDYVYVVPGEIVHVDNTSDAETNSYLKTFVDFFMISKAVKAYLIYSDLLYMSGFPKRAAEINNIPFEAVKF